MAQISKPVVDSMLRASIFEDLFNDTNSDKYQKINDRQYGGIIVDANGVERYCRVGVIVAELREDMTARELMGQEIRKYTDAQAKKAEAARIAAEKRKAKENENLPSDD